MKVIYEAEWKDEDGTWRGVALRTLSSLRAAESTAAKWQRFGRTTRIVKVTREVIKTNEES